MCPEFGEARMVGTRGRFVHPGAGRVSARSALLGPAAALLRAECRAETTRGRVQRLASRDKLASCDVGQPEFGPKKARKARSSRMFRCSGTESGRGPNFAAIRRIASGPRKSGPWLEAQPEKRSIVKIRPLSAFFRTSSTSHRYPLELPLGHTQICGPFDPPPPLALGNLHGVPSFIGFGDGRCCGNVFTWGA